MDSLLFSKSVYALIIFVISVLSGLLPLTYANKNRAQNKLGSSEFVIGEALAAGVFLGAGLLHMLSDAAQDFNELGYHYPFAALLCGIIFLALLLLEHVGKEVKDHSSHSSEGSTIFALLAVAMLSVHSLFEGIALGIRNDLSLVIIVFIAIMAHKWADSYSLAIHVSKSRLKNSTNWVIFFIFTLMTPFGIFFGNYIDTVLSGTVVGPVFTSLAAGTFLYIGTLHGLNRAVMVERCCNLRNYTYVIIGFVLMAAVGIWI